MVDPQSTAHWVKCSPDDPSYPIELEPGQSIVELAGCCIPLDPAIAELLFPAPKTGETELAGCFPQP